jgi:hypothetical protein
MKNEVVENNLCRLCGAETKKLFLHTVLSKYDVNYSECINCKSLQTDMPFWLDESYLNNIDLPHYDTGAVQRSIHHFAMIYCISKLLKFRNIIDFGGGNGLLCRLLRDFNLNCFVSDKYADATYAKNFTDPDFETPDLVTSFEVLEHLPNPSLDLDKLFIANTKAVILSTEIYRRQGKDWWYIGPECGHHVFFYSLQSLIFIANKYDYELYIFNDILCYFKKGVLSKFNFFLLKILLNNKINRLIKSLIFLLPASGISNDFIYLKNKNK